MGKRELLSDALNRLVKTKTGFDADDEQVQRVGKPADVAQLVAFLATAEPFFITGQAITIDGFQWEI